MIAIDTNVLLRYLLADDAIKAAKASALINGPQPVLLTDVVLAETIWTLSGKKYRLDQAGILSVLYALFAETNLYFEDAQTVWRALHDYRQATVDNTSGIGNALGFADALIVNKAKFCIAKRLESFGGVYTFDKAAQQIAGTKSP